MVITGPRHGKTTTCSLYGISWYLTHFPERSVIFGSHTSHFAGTWGQKVRDLISAFGSVNGARIGARRARQDWTTAQGGGMRSIGARKGSGATGLGGHLLVMDDSVASQQDALSKTVQDGTWNWWQADFSSRQTPDMRSSIVVIGTRWSERDLMGRLIAAYEEGPEAEGYEPWKILYLPAINDGLDWTGNRPYVDPMGRKIGQALWARWNESWLANEERRKPWWFAALFMGRPQPLEGGLLKQAWWNYWQPVGYDLGDVMVGGDPKTPRLVGYAA